MSVPVTFDVQGSAGGILKRDFRIDITRFVG
jgi:hypothetical protein